MAGIIQRFFMTTPKKRYKHYYYKNVFRPGTDLISLLIVFLFFLFFFSGWPSSKILSLGRFKSDGYEIWQDCT